MKKLKILIISAFLTFGGYCIGQDSFISLKHLKNSHIIEGSFLYSTYGMGGLFAYHYYIIDDLSISAGASLEKGNIGFTDYTQFLLDFRLNYSIYNINNKVFLNFFVSPKFGSEVIKEANINESVILGNPPEKMSEENLAIGASLGSTIEFYVTDQVAINATYDQYLYISNKLNNPMFTIQIGVKYNF